MSDRHHKEPDVATDPADASTGLPGFRTWRAVYLFVFGALVVDIALLAAFSHAFR